MTQITGKDDGTFPLTHRKTGSIKRLIMVTYDSAPHRNFRRTKGPDYGQKGHEESGQMRQEWDINETYETSALFLKGCTGRCSNDR